MAHAAPAARGRHIDRSALTRPLMLGLVYGVYAAFLERQTGPVDAGNVFYGILCGALFAACLVAMARIAPRMMQELRALMYGAFAAVAMGYLYSLTGDSVLRSAGIGLLTGAGVAVVAFYRYHTREP
ncbi:hypothetical protein [Streptomyces antimicrobicus]|uniref:Integral membrane protein n=1 Tax=Streptomyces antimicrobicus TaxID=2883108 RepID=A0ABS8B9L4_9ACTN|nr:hypothetical protein [Streptomyces antimicrobicus]MCB5181278.1 hypothetical protein [Streptomyces antimicrobicus]